MQDGSVGVVSKIDILEAMRMATTAWNQVTPETVAKTWQHVKILPDSGKALPPTERYIDPNSLGRLNETLDELVEIAVAPIGRPTIDELINVPGEEVTEAQLTTEEIVEMVQNEETETECAEDESLEARTNRMTRIADKAFYDQLQGSSSL